MEGVDYPVYVFTYSLEMTQFVHADPLHTNVDPIDHSSWARSHT
jgi:hypothetical protein